MSPCDVTTHGTLCTFNLFLLIFISHIIFLFISLFLSHFYFVSSDTFPISFSFSFLLLLFFSLVNIFSYIFHSTLSCIHDLVSYSDVYLNDFCSTILMRCSMYIFESFYDIHWIFDGMIFYTHFYY